MHGRKALAAAAFIAAASLFAGCGTGSSGGGGNVNPPPGNPGPGPTPNLVNDSINAMNATGALALSEQYLEMAQMSPLNSPNGGPPTGVCRANGSAGYEFFVPDKANDKSSSERIVFYDSACTQPATDAVRKYTLTSFTTETVTRHVSRWLRGATAPNAIRDEAISYTGVVNGFDAYGYPNLNAPLSRTSTSTFNFTTQSGNSFTVHQNDEFIAGTQKGAVLPFCADDAGMNAMGNFGFATQTDSHNGTITTNPDGSTTFAMTRVGYAYPSGNLQLNVGSPNASCPITTPYYTITGGNTPGQYILPISITIANPNETAIPPVYDMETTGTASFPNGETLTITTSHPTPSPTSTATVVITGTLTNYAGKISEFTVDGYGTGTLTMTATGTIYSINGWHASPTPQNS